MEFFQKIFDLLFQRDKRKEDKKEIEKVAITEDFPKPHCETGYRKIA